MVHAVTRPLIELWAAGSSESWRQLPTPVDAPFVHSMGCDPDRILLIGGGVAVGYGVSSHELALAGHLARQISERTRRGVDVDIRVSARASMVDAVSTLNSTSLSRFDATFAVLGDLEALELVSESQFRRELLALLEILDDSTPRAFLLSVGPMAIIPTLPSAYTAAVGRRMTLFNAIMTEECARTRVTFVDISRHRVPGDVLMDRHRYSELASVIAPHLSDVLDESPRSHPPDDVDEAVRIKALHQLNVLDSIGRPEFDEVVETARNIFGTDGAALNFIDSDHQWVKSFSGLHPGNLPRSEALCNITIQRPKLFVVEDLSADPRFSSLSWVGGQSGARFYAGYPIETPEGLRVGVLCLIDSKPRTFSPKDHALLRQLALRLQALVTEQAGLRRLLGR
ncbi:MAG: GAF domain-containing protein [Salinibacterium sp.]|nr:GAF domain-containing protein [Salinibacterium sp.]